MGSVQFIGTQFHYITNALSARSPCNLGPRAYVAISVLLEVSENTVLARYHFFLEVPDRIHEKCLRVYPQMLALPRPQDVQKHPPTILADLATSFPVPDRCPPVRLLTVQSCATGLPKTRRGAPRRRKVAGRGEESSAVESCGFDVGDVLAVELEELVDVPGTTMGS